MNIFRSNLTQYPPTEKDHPYPEDDGATKEQSFHTLDDVILILRTIEKEARQAREPVVLPLLPATTNANSQVTSQPWIVDKRNRKHLFAMVSGTTTVNFVSDDGFTVTVGNTWENVGFPEGTRFTPSTANVNVLIAQIATDEVIP